MPISLGLQLAIPLVLCTSVFKRTVDYYRNLGSHVFVCFIDFAEAFDLKLLLDKLLDDDCNPAVIKLLAF
jgi:hypothetical protein